MKKKSGYIWIGLWFLWVTTGMGLWAPAILDASAAPAKRVIWSAEPVVIPPNQPKFIERYDCKFDQVWGTSVYPIDNGRLD